MNSYKELKNTLKKIISKDTVFICIGTDRCIADSLGPLVGTFLKEMGFPLPVYGTIYEPIHAMNIEKKLNEIKKNFPYHQYIAIDACLGDKHSIGDIRIKNLPLSPGKALSKNLPEIGDYSIVGFVGELGDHKIFYNGSNRLSSIYKMSRIIAVSIFDAYVES
ncbi:spore protease YyaC [Clostridium sp.]|uniref:spore protease YyaC n=1 Tax=Clostridium sp. TaxID=1506 RepID=UPI0025BD46CF|nr:spore protease YyaC [Clostridium sp.]